MLFSRKSTALKGAERVLEVRDKILKAIANEEKALESLVLERWQAEIALSATEAADALQESADVPGARKRLTEACSAVDRQGAKLAGLRLRLAQQASELSAQRDGVKKVIPEHMESLKNDFEREWYKAVSTFSALLGKRQAIETLSGSKMNLPEPKPVLQATPIDCLSDDVLAPSHVVGKLEAALADLMYWRRQADLRELELLPPGMRKALDPNKVYRLTIPVDNLEAGAFVVESSFVPGMLARVVARGEAIPADAQNWNESLLTAQRATTQFVQEERAAAEKKHEPA